MSKLPDEPGPFADHVVQLLATRHPDFTLERLSPSEVLVNGRRLDIENLRRLVTQAPDRGSEIVEQYLSHLFENDPGSVTALPWEIARTMVMPRIHHNAIFNRLERELVAHIPFVNDTAVLFVIDLPHMTVSITTEQMIKWDIDAETLDDVARENLAAISDAMDIRLVESKEGGRAAVLAHRDGYDASRLLLPNLHGALAPELGGDFLVSAPARDLFVAISLEPDPFVKRMQGRAAENFHTLPYPITQTLFYVTRDGVAGSIAA